MEEEIRYTRCQRCQLSMKVRVHDQWELPFPKRKRGNQR